jgi:hypothetical protein
VEEDVVELPRGKGRHRAETVDIQYLFWFNFSSDKKIILVGARDRGIFKILILACMHIINCKFLVGFLLLKK